MNRNNVDGTDSPSNEIMWISRSSYQEQETSTSEMEEEKTDKEKKVVEEGQTDGKVPNTPPIIRFPCCPMPFKTIEVAPMTKNTEYVTETPRCMQIVARLEREIVVAVATEGVNVSKEGPLTLLQIGTCSGTVYVFDILLNRDLISKGRLRSILGSEKIVKVMHQCGQVSAALNYQFAVTLNNVFDTQVAHLVLEEHRGRRLPTGLKVSEICLQYADQVEKFFSYDWRTDSKLLWTSMIGHFWAIRPLTTEMIEFAAGDVIVLIPDIYRIQKERLEENDLIELFEERVEEEVNVEIDNIVKETKGKRLAQTVEQILREMDMKYDDRIKLFGVLEEDEVNALALMTFDDAEEYSSHIRRLKSEYILKELDGIEVQLRTGPECWELRSNLLQSLMFYKELSNPDIKSKSNSLLRQALDAILDHVEVKYSVDTITQMLATCEKEAVEAIDYKAVISGAFGNVVSTLFWKLVQEDIHEKINFFRLYPQQFALSDYENAKLEFFRENTSSVPEEVISLSAGLLDAVRAYSVTTGINSDLQRRQTPLPDV